MFEMFDPLPPGPHLVMVHSTNSMQPPLLCLLLGYPLPLPVSDVLYVWPLVQAASINACGSATPLKDKLTAAVGRGRRQSGRLIMHKRGVCQDHSFFQSLFLAALPHSEPAEQQHQRPPTAYSLGREGSAVGVG